MSPRTISPTTFHALVATEEGIYDSQAGRMLLADRSVSSIAVDDHSLYALVDGSELHRIEDGRTEPVARIARGRASVVHVHRGSVWVGGDSAGLWRLDAGDLVPVESFHDAPTSSEWSTPWGGPPAVFSFASSGEDLFVSVHVGGILRTSDQGRSWQATIDLNDDVHHVAAASDGTLWAATGHRALARSDDRGETWSHHRDGLHSTYLLAVAATDAGALVGASSGPFASDGTLYRFDGAVFDRVGPPFPAELHGVIGPRRLTAAGRHAAVVTPDGSLYLSADSGRSWEQQVGGLPDPAEVVLAADRGIDQT